MTPWTTTLMTMFPDPYGFPCDTAKAHARIRFNNLCDKNGGDHCFYAPKEHLEAYMYSNRTVRPFVRPSSVRCISPKFFEVGIQNLVCGCILRW